MWRATACVYVYATTIIHGTAHIQCFTSQLRCKLPFFLSRFSPFLLIDVNQHRLPEVEEEEPRSFDFFSAWNLLAHFNRVFLLQRWSRRLRLRLHSSIVIGFTLRINGMQIGGKMRSNRCRWIWRLKIGAKEEVYSMRRSLPIEAERRRALIHCVIVCLLSAAK